MIDLNEARTLDELNAANNFDVDVDDVRDRINDDVEGFVQWLCKGRALIKNGVARIANVQGEAGASLKIELRGPKRGVWYDHSTKQTGDLLALYRLNMGFTGNADDFLFSVREIAKYFLHDPIEVEPRPWRPTPIEKIQADAVRFGDRPIADMVQLGAPVASFKYLDVNGKLLAIVRRYEPDGTRASKTFRPYCFKLIDGVMKWISAMPDPRPLYRLPAIAAATDVILTEGEAKADALAALGFAATSVMGGANSTGKIDWTSLAGKAVTIWPDADTAGATFARDATAVLMALGCRVAIVQIPVGKTDGWDAVNCIAEGGDAQALIDGAVEVAGQAYSNGNSSGAGTGTGSAGTGSTTGNTTGNGSTSPPSGIPLDYYENFSAAVTKDWIIKGVIAKGETSSWIGPPGSGKSALLASVAMDAAAGEGWRGFRSKQRVGVVYFALERAQLAKRRLIAMAGPPNLPIAVAGKVIDLISPTCVTTIVDTVRAAEAHFKCPVGLIIIDTFNKGIAAGGGDEDKAMYQNIAAANLRGVHELLIIHIALVGHTGKDESRGARGSNAHLGDVDMMVQISVEGDIRTATITMINDGAVGVLTRLS